MNNQNSLDEILWDIMRQVGVNSDDQKLVDEAKAAINKTIMEARINQCERLDPYIDPEFRELYEQELERLTKKYGGKS